jgi:hypothetical protein
MYSSHRLEFMCFPIHIPRIPSPVQSQNPFVSRQEILQRRTLLIVHDLEVGVFRRKYTISFLFSISKLVVDAAVSRPLRDWW